MDNMQQILSPIIKNRDAIIDESQEEGRLIDKIIQQKMDLFEKQITPSFIESIRPEIAQSWLRCYNYGLEPCRFNNGPVLDEPAFAELTRKESSFIQAVDPYINKLKGLLSETNYLILVNDPNGVFLRVIFGNNRVIDHVNKKFNLGPAVIWTEETTGTCSKEICSILDTPIQLCGPEFYSHVFYDAACSSAPIHDVFNNLTGTITIVSPFSRQQNPHSLALAVSSAWTIENELRLTLNRILLNTAMESTDEAIITVNNLGNIINANTTARNILIKTDQNHLNLTDVLGDQPLIQSALDTGEKILDTDIMIGESQRLHLRLAQPVTDKHGKIFGYMFNFRNIKQKKSKFGKVGRGPKKQITFNDIVGNLSSLEHSIKLAKKYASLDGNILIQGESGTGKELYAQAIHNQSRPDGPFFAVNCAAIPKDLIESELFGYEGGAFTGAQRQGQPGKIQMAHGGTLFLDEIGDMSLELQPVLLRVLEEKMVIRVGGCQYIPVDFRLITASNKDLLELVQKKQFREDLYYRLAVFNINIPPLRERGADIIRLAKHFINSIADKQQISPPALSDAALYWLLHYNWPGNVRQLENVMLSAVSVAADGEIKPGDLPEIIVGQVDDSSLGEDHVEQGKKHCDTNIGNGLSMKELEKITIIQTLMRNGNKVSEAAKNLGMSRATLYRKIKEYNIFEEILGKK